MGLIQRLDVGRLNSFGKAGTASAGQVPGASAAVSRGTRAAPPQRCYGRLGSRFFLAVHGGGNPRADRIICGAERIGRQMSVSRCRRGVLVAQQSANYGQAQAARGANARKAMPQIMESDVG